MTVILTMHMRRLRYRWGEGLPPGILEAETGPRILSNLLLMSVTKCCRLGWECLGKRVDHKLEN